jgi:hypothetical protein
MCGRFKEESSSFLKKRTKKLLCIGRVVPERAAIATHISSDLKWGRI